MLLCIFEPLMTKFTEPTFGACEEDGEGPEPPTLAFHEFRFILLFFRMLAWYAARMAVVASLATLLLLPVLDGR
jgi:hypothetical protein